MRRFALLLGAMWVLASGPWAGTGSHAVAQSAEAHRHFETGNQRYEQGRHQEAIAAYQSALDAGYTSGALYYNLGTAYFRTGDLGRTVLYYEKARRLLPGEPKLRHSLDVVRSAAGLPAPPAPQGWDALATSIPPSSTLLWGLLLYAVGAGVLGYRLWTGARPALGRASIVPLAVGVLLAGLAMGASWLRTLDQRAVVTAPEAPLHRSPIDQAARDTTLQAGTVLVLQRRQPGWTEVRLPDGRVGWLRAETLANV